MAMLPNGSKLSEPSYGCLCRELHRSTAPLGMNSPFAQKQAENGPYRRAKFFLKVGVYSNFLMFTLVTHQSTRICAFLQAHLGAAQGGRCPVPSAGRNVLWTRVGTGTKAEGREGSERVRALSHQGV